MQALPNINSLTSVLASLEGGNTCLLRLALEGTHARGLGRSASLDTNGLGIIAGVLQTAASALAGSQASLFGGKAGGLVGTWSADAGGVGSRASSRATLEATKDGRSVGKGGNQQGKEEGVKGLHGVGWGRQKRRSVDFVR